MPRNPYAAPAAPAAPAAAAAPPAASRLAWLGGVLLALAALPMPLLALLPANRYEGLGMEGIDCDSPGRVLFFGALTALVYGMLLAACLLAAWRQPGRRKRLLAAAVLCALVLGGVTPNVLQALRHSIACETAELEEPGG